MQWGWFWALESKLPKIYRTSVDSNFRLEVWREESLGEREILGAGCCGQSFEERDTKGYAENDLEKFKLRNFRRMSGTFEESLELPQNFRNFRGNVRNFRSFQENSANFEIWADFDTWNSWDRFWIDIDWDSKQRLRIEGLEHSHNKNLAKQSNKQMPILNYVTKSFQD